MHTAKVVIHEVKRDGGNVILQLLRERIGQPLNRRMLIRMVRFWRSTKWPTRVANDAVVFRQNSSPIIPTNRRATLSEAEGEVWLSGGIPTVRPPPCRTREFYQNYFTRPLQLHRSFQTPSLSTCHPESRAPIRPQNNFHALLSTWFVLADAMARVRERLLPRLVFPTAKPLFLPSKTAVHERFLPSAAGLVDPVGTASCAISLPAPLALPNPVNDASKSIRWDTAAADRATGLPCVTPIKRLRSRPDCRPKVVHVYHDDV
jgi:hypothetical protein